MSEQTVSGRYRHYKSNEYTVLGVARHSETLEELVVYRQEYGDRGLWVRPKQMFLESVTVDGQQVPRFQPVGPQSCGESGSIGSLFDGSQQPLAEEIVQTLVSASDVRIERIVSHGQCSPEGFWYDQAQHEWVAVLRGAARLRFEHRTVEMNPGDFINIPAHQRHRVEWATPDEPTVWLAVHYANAR
jgi:cupin 2 domain-containing protein